MSDIYMTQQDIKAGFRSLDRKAAHLTKKLKENHA